MLWNPTFLMQRSECSGCLRSGFVLNWYSIATDPSTTTEEKKRGIFGKASRTKEAVKQSADEKVPEDVRDESSGSETKGRGMIGRIRGMRVIFIPAIRRAGIHLLYLRTAFLAGSPRSIKIALAMNSIVLKPSYRTNTSPPSAVTSSSIAERRLSLNARNTTIIRLA